MPYWRLYYHFVWAARNRDPLIDEAVEMVIRKSLARTAETLRARNHAAGIVTDHAHLLVSIPTTIAPADATSRFKGASSHAVCNALPAVAFRWQAEYGVLSFSERGLKPVIQCVESQRERHQSGELLAPLEYIQQR